MLDFKRVFEDGDYVLFQSTNHSDPDRIAEIVECHDQVCADNVLFSASIVDREDNLVWEQYNGFFETFDQARRHLECEVTHKIFAGKSVIGQRIGR